MSAGYGLGVNVEKVTDLPHYDGAPRSHHTGYHTLSRMESLGMMRSFVITAMFRCALDQIIYSLGTTT